MAIPTITNDPDWRINTFIDSWGEAKIPTDNDTKVWYGNLPHPFFNPGKLWPHECPIVLQLEPNNVSKIFYSNDGHTPILTIVDIAIIDTVLMVDSGISTMSADSMIKADKGWEMQFIKPSTQFFNLTNSTRWDFISIIQGTWPELIIIGFIPNNSRSESKARTFKLMSKFPNITKLQVFNGEQEWPKKGGIQFRNMPDFRAQNMTGYHNDAQLKTMIDENKDIFEDLRSVLLPNRTEAYEMAWTAHHFFTCQCWIPISFEPYDRSTEVPNVVFPKETGDMRITIELKHALTDAGDWSMVIMSFRKSEFGMKPPLWQLFGNF